MIQFENFENIGLYLIVIKTVTVLTCFSNKFNFFDFSSHKTECQLHHSRTIIKKDTHQQLQKNIIRVSIIQFNM